MSSYQYDRSKSLSAGTPDSLLTLNDYLYEFKGIRRVPSELPFYIEIVDENGKLERIPWPPIEDTSVNPENRAYIMGLKLMVNPSAISLNLAKIINRTQTMTGWVEEHWGEEIDTITLNGSSAAFTIGGRIRDIRSRDVANLQQDRQQARADFYSALGIQDLKGVDAVTRRQLEISPGLSIRRRRDTLSYKEFKKLTQIFVSNGCIFDNQGFVTQRRFIRLSFDYASYLGYFESLDITEDAAYPFRFIYTITFKSEKTEYNFVSRRMPVTQNPVVPENDGVIQVQEPLA